MKKGSFVSILQPLVDKNVVAYERSYIFAECNKGYFSEFCDKPCPPGSFGFMCGGQCFPKCSKKVCNHVSGCPNDIEYTSNQIHTGIYGRT